MGRTVQWFRVRVDRISCFSRDGRAKGIEVDGGRRDCCIFFFRSLFRPIVSFLDPPDLPTSFLLLFFFPSSF